MARCDSPARHPLQCFGQGLGVLVEVHDLRRYRRPSVAPCPAGRLPSQPLAQLFIAQKQTDLFGQSGGIALGQLLVADALVGPARGAVPCV